MSKLFSFVIPLIDKDICSDWSQVQLNLNKTLASILNQRDSRFVVFVIARDIPNIETTDSRVNLITKNFPCEVHENDTFTNRSIDKGRKMYVGVNNSRRVGANYVMPLDADDLVHKSLVGHCLSNATVDAWFVSSGYIYEQGSAYIYKKYSSLNQTCGSCNILALNIFNEDLPDLDGGFDDYRLLINHQYTKRNVERALNVRTKTIPFPAIIYHIHSSNWYAKNRNRNFINLCKRMLFNRRITKAIRNNFFLEEN